MSYIDSSAAAKVPLKRSPKAVLLALADRAAKETAQCWPSIRRVAKETGLGERTVSRHLAALERMGLISRDRRTRKNGSRTTDLITLHVRHLAGNGTTRTQTYTHSAESETYHQTHSHGAYQGLANLYRRALRMRPLHDHQKQAISRLREALRSGSRRPMLQAPTGSGKTQIAAAIVEMARDKGNRAVFTVPAKELIDQTVKRFYAEGIRDVGVIQADHHMTDCSKPVQIASVQTLQRRLLPEADIVIVDEAHRSFAFMEEWMTKDEWLDVPFIGLSATPWTKGLGRLYDRLIIAATTEQLIDQGYLSPFKVFAPTHPDLTGVRTVAGDFHESDLAKAMNKRTLTADIVSTWIEKGRGRPTLCFAVDRVHAKTIQQQFEACGVRCGYLDAQSTGRERDDARKALASGDAEVICNVGVLTTGVDWDVRCIILARPTKSEILFTQIVGRGLRTAEGKDHCLILDHSDSTLRLGFVTDIHHDRLDGGKLGHEGETKPKDKAKPRECEKCHYVRQPGLSHCPSCGFVPEAVCNVKTEDGELAELDPKKVNAAADWPEKVAFVGQLRAYALLTKKTESWVAWRYRDKYGVWPNHPKVKYVRPAAGISPEVRAWITSRNIRHAKTAVA